MKNNLRPIERLYLISKENKEVYSKKNKLLAMIYFLYKNKSLYINKNGKKYKFQSGNIVLKQYEQDFIDFIKSKDFLNLDKLINGIHFEKTLIDENLYSEDIEVKKILFIPIAKKKIKKTSNYFELLSMYTDKLDKKEPIMNIIFEDDDLVIPEQVYSFYNLVVDKVKAASQEDKKKKEKDSKELMEDMKLS